MSTVTITLPDEILHALKVDQENIASELRLAAAAKLYELGRLSSGRRGPTGRCPTRGFLTMLADYGVNTVSLTEEQLQEQTRLA